LRDHSASKGKEWEKGTHEGKGQENGRKEMKKRGKKIPPNRFLITALDEGVVKVSNMRRGTAHARLISC